MSSSNESQPHEKTDKDPKYSSLSPTGLSEHWVVWKTRGPAAMSHVSIAVGFHGPVTRHRVMRVSVYGPRRLVVAPVWALTHCRRWGASQVLCGSGAARASHTDRYAAPRRTERRPREILGRKRGLGGNERAEERSTLILGTARHARSSHNHITSYQSRCAALVVTFTHGVYGHTCSSHNHIGFRINPDLQH